MNRPTREGGSDPNGQRRLIIAMDGPSGAGKGTVAREVARRLDYHHIDTGAMYRAVAWKALREGIDLSDEDATADAARRARIIVGDGVASATTGAEYCNGIQPSVPSSVRTGSQTSPPDSSA